jgi:ABC-type polysaccharide/polyol phosphate export permease
MFATPTIYTQPAADSSRTLQVLLIANPMTGLIAAFRACVLGGDIPWGPLATVSGPVLVLFILCCLYFRRVEDGFADII